MEGQVRMQWEAEYLGWFVLDMTGEQMLRKEKSKYEGLRRSIRLLG